MKKRRLIIQKTVSLLSGSLLVFQSLFPSISAIYLTKAFAQEETPIVTETPEPTPVTTPDPTPTDTISPTTTPEITITLEPTPTAEPAITETPTPTEEITPTAEPTPTQADISPTEEPKNNSPPADDLQGQILDGASTIAPTEPPTPIPTITPVEPETGELQAKVLKNIKSETLDLDGVNLDGSAKLSTDKADYAPTDTVIISGSDFIPKISYTLIITSSDEPPVRFETSVTTDDQGSFILAYQLDGKPRINYKIEAIRNEIVIAQTTFTDPIPLPIVPNCVSDSDGANDEPGQKDLTQFCQDGTAVNPLIVSWNWDTIDMGNGNNSADGCSLFDTDNDGNANYALCVSWKNDRQQSAGSPYLYSCSDTQPDRCPGKTPVTISHRSYCQVGLANDDPFSAGESHPQDAVAYCSINLDDVGGSSTTKPLDVCSYPSDQPNSDPSDCVLISDTKGNLSVLKDVVPNDTNTHWDISVSGPSNFTDTLIGDDSTGIKAVAGGCTTSVRVVHWERTLPNILQLGPVQSMAVLPLPGVA